mmetsp:Transcript_4383/g.5407  ORF Transcript_4383/g.5407 Transcript_4383/m.5407 type:complete len:166 (-) Transcript_4383:46-543(-)
MLVRHWKFVIIIHFMLAGRVLLFAPRFVNSPGNMEQVAKNVLGGALQCCCNSPKTGFYRDGYCKTGPMDLGSHTVCAVVTPDFLEFTAQQGNDLSTPRPEFDFPGLQAGDKWCLCALRWLQAYQAGCAPSVVLEASHEKALEVVPREILEQFRFNTNNDNENVNE